MRITWPEVVSRANSSNWGNWILKETGAHGFRFDAVKHISVRGCPYGRSCPRS